MAISDYVHQETTVAPPADPSAAGHREYDVEESFDRIVDQGRARTRRPWADLLATGAVGGIEVGFGILALLSVEMMTGSKLLGGLAFSIGFIALLLGHSELFTEGFLVPVTVVVAGEARLRDLLRFWVGTLLGNLAGGLLLAYLVDKAFPDLQAVANSTAASYINAGLSLRTFCLAVLAGGAITLLTRMHNGTDEMLPKMVASIAIAFLLAGVHLFHSVLDSLLAFTALCTGHAPFGWLDWMAWFVWAVAGNLVGGLVLTTVLRLVRSRRRLGDYREANDRPTTALVGRPRRPEG
ncbi:MAG: formate/nitrite transporter family protein [Acidimicrobiales bacterium]